MVFPVPVLAAGAYAASQKEPLDSKTIATAAAVGIGASLVLAYLAKEAVKSIIPNFDLPSKEEILSGANDILSGPAKVGEGIQESIFGSETGGRLQPTTFDAPWLTEEYLSNLGFGYDPDSTYDDVLDQVGTGYNEETVEQRAMEITGDESLDAYWTRLRAENPGFFT